MTQAAVLNDFSTQEPDPERRSRRARAQAAFLRAFAKGRLNYTLTFVSDASIVALSLGWAVYAWKGDRLWIPVFAVAGNAGWGISEYAFHRWLYHRDHGIFAAGHALHHAEERAPVALPWFVSTGVMLSIWIVVAHLMRSPPTSAILGGWMTGAVYYSWMHHAMHHWTGRGRWMRRMQARHRIHHRFPETNLGVTTRMWDRLFGTEFRGRG
jgi:sterol desaturase/sphingolipid hydroxylase (fatty acid hydroxylase superfamily)